MVQASRLSSDPRGSLRLRHRKDLQPVPLRLEPTLAAQPITDRKQLRQLDALNLPRVEPDQQVVRPLPVNQLVVRLILIKQHPLNDPRILQQPDRAVHRRLRHAESAGLHGCEQLIRLEQPIHAHDRIQDSRPLGRVLQPLGLELPPEDSAQGFDDLKRKG